MRAGVQEYAFKFYIRVEVKGWGDDTMVRREETEGKAGAEEPVASSGPCLSACTRCGIMELLAIYVWLSRMSAY